MDCNANFELSVLKILHGLYWHFYIGCIGIFTLIVLAFYIDCIAILTLTVLASLH